MKSCRNKLKITFFLNTKYAHIHDVAQIAWINYYQLLLLLLLLLSIIMVGKLFAVYDPDISKLSVNWQQQC